MMFTLRIYFLGLIAFVPNQEGDRMTALIVNVRDAYYATDGTRFPPHFPALLAPAGRCQGECSQDLQDVANHLFDRGTRPSATESLRQLQSFLGGGGAWAVDGEEITIELPADTRETRSGLKLVLDRRPVAKGPGLSPVPLPNTQDQGEDFSWVAEIDQILPEAAQIDPDCLGDNKKGLIAGRMRLTTGTAKTYRLVYFNELLPRFSFQPLVPGPKPADYSQGLAEIVAVDIPVSGCEVTLTAKKIGSCETRSMKLSPGDCSSSPVMEIALVNLPDDVFRPRGEQAHAHESTSNMGTHFELFYELADRRPSWRQRVVPKAGAEGVNPDLIDPAHSGFMNNLGLPRTGGYSGPICPQTVFAASPDA